MPLETLTLPLAERSPQRWVAPFATFLAVGTFCVVVAGGAVTSTRSGLADLNWPLFEGNLLPSPSEMMANRGKFYEHGHRMIAGTMVVLTWVFALSLWKARDPRRWLKRLAVGAGLVGLIPALLGGLTVLSLTPPGISIIHVLAAMLFLSFNTSLAVVTGKHWEGAEAELGSQPRLTGKDASWLASASIFCTLALYLQILFGAVLRQTHTGDVQHILWAFGLFTGVVLLSARVLGRHSEIAGLLRPGMALLILVLLQVFLGVVTYVARPNEAKAPGFARLCSARGVDLPSLTRAEDIPAVPTDVFKLTRVATFDPSETRATFRTSGTTIGARGVHEMRDPSTYEAAALAFGRQWLVRDLAESIPVVVLAPRPEVASDSSLGHMCASFVRAFGEPASPEQTWFVDGEVIDIGAFDERVAVALAKEQPMLVLATSFALVHFLDALGDATFALPAGSRVMQTGGFKGRSREVSAEALQAEVARVFCIDERAIVCEYGMTELSSQFYERTLFDKASKHGLYAEPPWARVVPVDPESLEPVAEGEIGIAKIIDLMNVDSAVAVLTQDRVRRPRGASGFELLGRVPGAPSRGCSIAIDEILGKNTN